VQYTNIQCEVMELSLPQCPVFPQCLPQGNSTTGIDVITPETKGLEGAGVYTDYIG